MKNENNFEYMPPTAKARKLMDEVILASYRPDEARTLNVKLLLEYATTTDDTAVLTRTAATIGNLLRGGA